MIIYAVALHLVWGVLGLVDPAAYDSTAFSALFRLFGYATSPICFAVAASALVGIGTHGRLKGLAFMLPQQTILLISAFGAVHAMMLSQFADGVIRPRAFIIADQVPAVITAIGHTVSMVRFAIGRNK
jgi:hypothetical protein